MTRVLNSFKVSVGNKILDYHSGKQLNLNQVKLFFQKKYNVKRLWNGNRHVLGILNRNNIDYFLKLSTSEGISVVTKNEYEWNNYFNKNFLNKNFIVPKNHGSGFYKQKYFYCEARLTKCHCGATNLFYLITDYFKGELLCETGQSYEQANMLVAYMPQVIKLSELIQKLPGKKDGYRKKFMTKTNKWFNDIPADVRKRYNVKALLEAVESGVNKLLPKVRHGDFTPWHMIKMSDGRLALVDGEHFLPNGIENYDICYFIQRVFSVLKNPEIAKRIYSELIKRGYGRDKLKVVLAARAIGGFLDESLVEKANYKSADSFKNWVLGIGI